MRCNAFLFDRKAESKNDIFAIFVAANKIKIHRKLISLLVYY